MSEPEARDPGGAPVVLFVQLLEAGGEPPYYHAMTTHPPAQLESCLPAGVYAAVKRAAELQGRSIADFVAGAAHDAARKAIEEEDIIRLSEQDQVLLARCLIDPPAPNEALLWAKKLHGGNVEMR